MSQDTLAKRMAAGIRARKAIAANKTKPTEVAAEAVFDPAKYDLQAKYDEFNKRFFGGKLERVAVKWKPLSGAHGHFQYSYSRRDDGIIYRPGTGVLVIDNKYARTEEFLDGIVLHEMCHVYVTTVLRNPGAENGGHNGQFLKKIDEIQAQVSFLVPKTEASDDGVTGATDVTQVYLLLLGKTSTNIHQYTMLDGRAMDNLVGMGQEAIDQEIEKFRTSLSSWNYTDTRFIGFYRVVNPFWSKFRLDRVYHSDNEAPSIEKAESFLLPVRDDHRAEFAKLVDGTATGLKRFGVVDMSEYDTPTEVITPTPIAPADTPLTGEALSVEEVGVLYAWYQRGDYESAIYEDELRKLANTSLADLQFASGRFSLLQRKLMTYTKIKGDDKGYFGLTEAGQEIAKAHFDAVDAAGEDTNSEATFPNIPDAHYPLNNDRAANDGMRAYLVAGEDDGRPFYISTDRYDKVYEFRKEIAVNLRKFFNADNDAFLTANTYARDLPFFFQYFLQGCKVTIRSVRNSIVQVGTGKGLGWDVGRLRAFVRTMDGIRPGFNIPNSIIGMRAAILGHLSQAANERPAYMAFLASRFGVNTLNGDASHDLGAVTDRILGGERASEFGDAPLVAYLTSYLPTEVYVYGPMITKHSDDGFEALFSEANKQLHKDFTESVTSAPETTNAVDPGFHINPDGGDDAYCIYAMDVGTSSAGDTSWDLRRIASNTQALPAKWRKGMVLDLNDPKYANERDNVEHMLNDIKLLLAKYRINVKPIDVTNLIDSIIERGGTSLYSQLKLDKVHGWFGDAFKTDLYFDLDQPYGDALLQLHTAITNAKSDDGAYNRFLITSMGLNDPNHDVANKALVGYISKHFGSTPDALGMWLMSWPAGVSKYLAEQGYCNPVAIAQVFNTATAVVWEQFHEANGATKALEAEANKKLTPDEAMEEGEDDAAVTRPSGPLPQASGNVRNLVLEYEPTLKRMITKMEPLDSDEAKKRRIGRVGKREAPAVAALLSLVMAPELTDLTESIRNKEHSQAAQQASKLATRLIPYFKASVLGKTPYPGIEDWITANFGEGLAGQKAAHKAILGTNARLTAAQRKYLTSTKTRKEVLAALGIKLR